MMTAIPTLFDYVDLPIPGLLNDWERQVNEWCKEYRSYTKDTYISEMNIDSSVFLFDHASERVVLAYAVSTEALVKRDASRMRRFPDVNKTVQKVLRDKAFHADKGHFLGHVSGGRMDINLFPQQRELNRGWSEEGKRFRTMERYVAKEIGSFFYHRPIYENESWMPDYLEYGVLKEGSEWWVDRFCNGIKR